MQNATNVYHKLPSADANNNNEFHIYLELPLQEFQFFLDQYKFQMFEKMCYVSITINWKILSNKDSSNLVGKLDMFVNVMFEC